MIDAFAASLVIGVASYRLWRLIAMDKITEPWRDRGLHRAPDWIDDLVSCPWCLGSWVAFAATWITGLTVGLRVPVLVALAAAVVVGVLGSWLE